MECHNSEQAVIDAQTLQQLQDEIQQEVRESLNKANFSKILEKYGMSTEEFLKFQCILYLTKVPSNQGNERQKIQNFLELIPSNIVNISVCTCWSDDQKKLVDCPCD